MTPLNIRLVSLTLLKLFHSKDGDLLIIQFYFISIILNLILFISIILCLILLISTETTSMLHIID